jgi:hypothetical protein
MAHRSTHPAGRTLHVIDIENLVGGSAAGPAAVGPALSTYRAAAPVLAGDHAVIGSGTTLAVAAGVAWPGAQLVLGRGIDGADRALLVAIDVAFIAAHYDRVVIASGDHCFAGLAWSLRREGLDVRVVTQTERSLARALREAAMHPPLALAS